MKEIRNSYLTFGTCHSNQDSRHPFVNIRRRPINSASSNLHGLNLECLCLTLSLLIVFFNIACQTVSISFFFYQNAISNGAHIRFFPFFLCAFFSNAALILLHAIFPFVFQFSIPCKNIGTLRDVNLVFNGGPLPLTPKQYVLKVKQQCVPQIMAIYPDIRIAYKNIFRFVFFLIS